jgi:hypothetical protein
MATKHAMLALGAAAWLAGAPVQAQLADDPAYIAGRDAWNGKRWPVAIDALRPLIEPLNRANYEVDYWLGTSLCRIDGRMAAGANVLDWALRFRSMPEAARPTLDAEKRLCVQQLALAAPPVAAPGTMLASAEPGRSTTKATMKLFAVGGDGLLAAAPIRVTRPLPIRELEARLVPLGAAERALAQAKTLAPGARYHVSKHTVIASTSPGHGTAQLKIIGDRLDDFIAFLGERFALPAPDSYIAVYLFPDIPKLQQAAMRLHGMQASGKTLGYTFGNDRSILGMMTGTGAGTLLHELFHTVVHESFGDIPQWLDEGIASLYETATAAEGLYFGEPNWRSKVYAELSRDMDRLRLGDLVTAPWFSDEPAVHRKLGERVYNDIEQAYLLAFARMFTLYLQETGSLHKVFDAYRKRTMPDTYVPATQRALQLLEAALGKPLGQVESDFRQWAPRAFDPATRFYAGNTRAQQVRKELPQATEVRRGLPLAAEQIARDR